MSAPDDALDRPHAPPGSPEERRRSRVLLLSLDVAGSPAITLEGMDGGAPPGHERPVGWGFAWYPGEDRTALVVKDARSIGDNPMTRILREWERFQSDVFLCHIRGALRQAAPEATQPFVRPYAGRDWCFAHTGDLEGDIDRALPIGHTTPLEPVGRSDSERAFCRLLSLCRAIGARRLADVPWERLHDWCRALNDLGTCNLVLTDGEDIAVYQDRYRYNGLSWRRIVPPLGDARFAVPGFHVAYGRDEVPRSLVAVATLPDPVAGWTPMPAGQLLLLRRGSVLHDSHAGGAPEAGPAPFIPKRRVLAPERLVHVVHDTRYRYHSPVDRSVHVFRLRPVLDRVQELIEHQLELSVPGYREEMEDVFGNQAVRFTVEAPYTELAIVTRSTVRIRGGHALALPPAGRFALPLVWMPWQRQMMLPYLLPPELPETQLLELSSYAMSFVARNGGDLVDTLADINGAIHRDYAYVSGSTSIETTPYEVFVHRRGVCQDFANLFVCLTRLLGIPSRYRTGYIFTGSDYANRMQSEASHAWAEVYIPEVGWRGFDPTNGSLAGTDHVRVACGRNYRDAAPTSGTIYAGGGGELLTVSVRVEEVPAERRVRLGVP
ncbi:MAG: class II glutamine amidotransferase [Gemmatimonadales bacterium]|nr:class II glutamine amidotransferase [Gemmatimonadales bacterium]